ncbi:Hsp20/alpha crystallin family protein [Sinorhizobium fredii]|uniref:HspC2 heat shock protein n=1 Tax=Sinorhizobium fredii (strain HH103) TaxID=1117943 RepID=G9ABF2_SINF1|nr:Hsp20/alpha crystallin family protein [Sinorhizobium fredii]MQW97191.1 Hsp20 family protein [Sinorhizobium fredii]UTY50476.1 Hsp20/alpha crystallin family protein [Sinorhizobium fredii]CCE97243.1 HspC2 heat shock protein [Sinorhizobium fredii HH103]
MAEPVSKLPIKTEEKAVEHRAESWHPFESLRSEIDRLFDDFAPTLWHRPFSSAFMGRMPRLSELKVAPAVDLAETEKSYEISCELPGMEEKDIEVAISNRTLTIRGEKQEVKEEKDKEYVLSERRYGSFQRAFQMPEGVDADNITANFTKGVLTVTLPKTPEAQQSERKIQIKPA